MEKPLLSIVVPTKDRYKYLKCLIELVESFDSDEIEIVVQDNSDENTEMLRFMENRPMKHLVYHHQQGQIPMSRNSDLAILNSSGKYVCFIGDDDGVTVDIIDCVKWMDAHGIEAVRSVAASYCWPEVGKNRFLEMGGRVVYDKPTKAVKHMIPYDTLMEIVKKGFISRGLMPLVYHGIVLRETLDRIFEIGGTYFPGSSPDISNGVALSLVTNKFVFYNKIVTFSGASKYHGGGVYTSGKKHPELSDIKWLLPGAVESWDKRLPLIGEGDSIWCDSAIKALLYMGRKDLEEQINFENLYVHFSLSHKDLIGMVLPLTKNKFRFYFKFINGLLARYYHGFLEMMYGRMNKIPGKKSATGLDDAKKAANYFHEINCRYN